MGMGMPSSLPPHLPAIASLLLQECVSGDSLLYKSTTLCWVLILRVLSLGIGQVSDSVPGLRHLSSGRPPPSRVFGLSEVAGKFI